MLPCEDEQEKTTMMATKARRMRGGAANKQEQTPSRCRLSLPAIMGDEAPFMNDETGRLGRTRFLCPRGIKVEFMTELLLTR